MFYRIDLSERKTFKKTNLLINFKAKGNRQGHFQHRYCIAKAAQNSLQWICTSNCIFNAFFLNIYVQNTRLYQGAHPHGYLHIHSPKAIDCVPAYRLDRGRALNVFLLQWQRQPSLLLLLFFFLHLKVEIKLTFLDCIEHKVENALTH